MLHFDVVWHALGPFAIGTREDPWYDTVDIEQISVSDKVYPSTLCSGATWKEIEMDLESMDDRSTSVSVELSYDEVDWTGLVQMYGWVATQFDAWIRGTIHVDEDCVVRLKVRNSPEFMLDGDRYEGDIYDIGHPILLPLSKGKHGIDIRVVNEIRIFGFKQSPMATIKVDVACLDSTAPLEVVQYGMPDFVRYNGRIMPSSPHFSLQLDCTSSKPVTVLHFKYEGRESGPSMLQIAPYQSRRVNLYAKDLTEGAKVEVFYTVENQEHMATVTISRNGPILEADTPHIITYINTNQSFGRAVIRPPIEGSTTLAPILLALHGANVDINSPAWKDIFKQSYLEAWVVQPDCGKWGDDWHEQSQDSIEKALRSLVQWQRTYVAWKGPSPDLSKILIMGHSNGAHGAMQFMMRNSHRVIGSALVSGYISIQKYVPYTMWRTNALAITDTPQYDITRNMDMVRGIKCFIRHGVEDDNVPIFHSRLLASLDPSFILEEVPHQGHWFDGILTEGRLKDFVEERLQSRKVESLEEFAILNWGAPAYRNGYCLDMVKANLTLPLRYTSEQMTFPSSCPGWKHLSPEEQSLANLGIRPRIPSYLYEEDFGDATSIFCTNEPFFIVGDHARDPQIAHRIAHSLLLYHGIDSEIARRLPRVGTSITWYINPKNELGLTVTRDQLNLILSVHAANAAQISRLIRLIPWRTGTGVSGKLRIDPSRGLDLVVSAVKAKLPRCPEDEISLDTLRV